MLGEAFEVLLHARCMLWFSTDMEWTPLSLFNGTYIYKWWVFQPATVCALSIRFHVTLRAMSLQKLDHPSTSTWKHCFFFWGGGEETQGCNTENNTLHLATVPLRCERHAKSCGDTGSTVTKWWLGKGRILDRQFEQWKSILFGSFWLLGTCIHIHISYVYLLSSCHLDLQDDWILKTRRQRETERDKWLNK